MIKDFLKKSFLYSLSNLFTKGINFIMLPIYTRILSQAQFGIYDYLIVIGNFVAVTVSFDITQGLFRYLPESETTTEEKTKYISTSLFFTIFCYTFFLAGTFLLSNELSMFIFNDSKNALLIKISSIFFATNAIIYLISNIFKAELKAKAATLITALSALLSAGFSLLFIMHFKMNVAGLFIGQSIGITITSILGLYLLRDKIKMCFSKLHLKKMLEFSLPLIPSSIAVILAMYVDRLIIKEYLSFEEVGLYAVAAKIAGIINLLIIGVQNSITPLIYSRYKETDTPIHLNKIYNSFLLMSFAIILVLALFSKYFVLFFGGENYLAASSIIPILASAFVFSSMYLFFPGLSIAKKTGTISIINIIFAAVNLALNYYLIPKFGIKGAAFATCLSGFMSWLTTAVVANKHYSIPVNKLYIGLYALGMFGILKFLA